MRQPKQSTKKKYFTKVEGIPEKISEIISYLAMDFSRNKSGKFTNYSLLDRDEISQDLYLLYLTMLKKNPKLAKQKPGYFFIKFKWFMLTKWKKRIREINKEWKYKLEAQNIHDQSGQYMGEFDADPFVAKLKKIKNRKKKTKYGFY